MTPEIIAIVTVGVALAGVGVAIAGMYLAARSRWTPGSRSSR